MASAVPPPDQVIAYAQGLLDRLREAEKRQKDNADKLAAAKEELLAAQRKVADLQDKVSQLSLAQVGTRVNVGNLVNEFAAESGMTVVHMPRDLDAPEKPSTKRRRPLHKGVMQLENYTLPKFETWPAACRLLARLLRSSNPGERVSPDELETARKYCALPGGDESNAWFTVYDDGSSPATVSILPALRMDMPDSLVKEYRTDKRGF